MQCKDIVLSYLSTLEGNFFCREIDKRLWVISPYSFPDGDLIEVAVIKISNDRVKVSDLGETLRHLTNLGFDPRSTPKGQYLLDDIIKRFHVDLEKGQIQKGGSMREIGDIMFSVICACLAIADLLYLSRAYQPATFYEEVAHFLIDNQIVFERKYTIEGATGKRYKVDFYFPRMKDKEGMLQGLSPKNQAGVKPVVDATFRLWSDVGNNRWLGTFLDDRIIRWKKEDIKLLEGVSKVHFWQEKDSLLKEMIRERIS